jgi:hypothetical protein
MIVLGYMKSCWRETISSIGAVIVGTEQSGVHLADVKAEKVPCDRSQAERQGRQGGGRERSHGGAERKESRPTRRVRRVADHHDACTRASSS